MSSCYLVELADSLLTTDVVLEIRKHLKPVRDGAEAPCIQLKANGKTTN